MSRPRKGRERRPPKLRAERARTSLRKIVLGWADIERMVGTLLRSLPRDYDALLVITRGGMVPACLISEHMNIRDILCAAAVLYREDQRVLEEPVFLNFPDDRQLAGRRILVVDDVWDSGSTIVAVRERVRKVAGRVDVAVLHFKPGRNRFPGDGPEFYVTETAAWIVYPWEPASLPPGQAARSGH